MKKEYDFSKMRGRKNPYAQKLKKTITIRLGQDVITYFKAMAVQAGLPYQQLINFYLRDCEVDPIVQTIFLVVVACFFLN